jgi:hypothetical protein
MRNLSMRNLGLITSEDDERAAVETGTKLCGCLEEGSLNPEGYVDDMATRGYGVDLSRPVLDGAIEASARTTRHRSQTRR